MKLNLEKTLRDCWKCTHKVGSGWECDASAVVGVPSGGRGLCLPHFFAHFKDEDWPEVQLREDVTGTLRDAIIAEIRRVHPDYDKPGFPTKIGCRTIRPYAGGVRFVGHKDTYELTLDHMRHLVSECERLAEKPKVRYAVFLTHGDGIEVHDHGYEGPYATYKEAVEHINHRQKTSRLLDFYYEIREVPA